MNVIKHIINPIALQTCICLNSHYWLVMRVSATPQKAFGPEEVEIQKALELLGEVSKTRIKRNRLGIKKEKKVAKK